jgi:hypothetical protein
MKLLVALSGIVLAHCFAYAAETPTPATKPTRPVPKWIQANDTNKNGRLDPEEIAAIKAVQASKLAEFKRQHDVDGDGKMSEAELKTMRQTLQAQRAIKEQQSREAVEQISKQTR